VSPAVLLVDSKVCLLRTRCGKLRGWGLMSAEHKPGRSYVIGLICLALLSTFLMFWRLDGTILWRDEATTATWARTMVEQRSLVPKVFDGETVAVQGFDAHDFNDSLTPGMQAWLQFYVTAISFELFGESTFTARLPFAICGLIAVAVMWLIGRRLYGDTLLALVFPFLSITSIWYLHVFRQSRYYGLVFLFSALLLYEFVRYLQQRELDRKLTWYLRVSLWSAGLYFSHYLGFAGMYAALCLFVLLLRDRALLWRWTAMTAILAVIFGAEFFSFHFDFAAAWSKDPAPGLQSSATLGERIAATRRIHSEELVRMVAILFLIPGLFWILRRRDGEGSGHFPLAPLGVSFGLAALVLLYRGEEWFPIAAGGLAFAVAILGYRLLHARWAKGDMARVVESRLMWLLPVALAGAMAAGFAVEHSDQNVMLYTFAECIVVGLQVIVILRLGPKPGEDYCPQRGLILLSVLVMVVSVVFTAVLGLEKGLPRYYYPVLMASLVLAAVVTADMFRWRRAAGVLFLIAFLVWPNFSFNIGSSFATVERQLTQNREVDYPIIEFFKTYAQPGDRYMVFRNVQGMTINFYLEDLQWVGQLDANHPVAARYKDRFPATAYDDYEDVHWYAVWDTRGKDPKGLDERFELVWELDYVYPRSWWDRTRGSQSKKTWKVYKRRDIDRGIGTPPTAALQQSTGDA
jgi:4-amino-4-deoxy-L-arabinose transferase-like glycosyltransferase